MPRHSRLMDYLARRDMAMGRDGRNPYGSRGGYVVSSRRRRDRAMDGNDYEMDREMDMRMDSRRDYAYEHDMMDSRRRRNAKGQYMADRAYDYEASMNRDYAENDMARNRRDYGDYESMDSRYDRNEMHDGHYPMVQGYRPIEAMGRFTGYYGMGDEDYARGGRGMRGGRDYADYGDYRDYAGDYGENLTMQELEHWRKKLDKEVGDEQSKNFFKKENIEQKAKQMGIEMKGFNADELAMASYMLYSDYCMDLKPVVGSNMDIYVKMGKSFLTDPDSAVKGGEKLALYKEIVSGEND